MLDDEVPAMEDKISGLFAPNWQVPPPKPPGAMSATCEDMLLNDEMTSCLSVEPTATAVEMQPGAEIALVKPLLPAAIAVATPTLLRLSMLALPAVGVASAGELAASKTHICRRERDARRRSEGVLHEPVPAPRSGRW